MISKRSDDPIAILIIASLVRDDFPWLYEIGLDAYRTAKGRNTEHAHDALRVFRDAAEATVRLPFIEEMGIGGPETHVMMRELPMIINRYMEILAKPVRKQTRFVKAAGSKEGEHS